MKRSASKLYKPWFGIGLILFAIVLVSACAVGGGSWRGLEIGITDCTNGDQYNPNDYQFDYNASKSAIIMSRGDYVPHLDSDNLSRSSLGTDYVVTPQEAYWSGLCNVSRETRVMFAQDLLNLTLVSPYRLRNLSDEDEMVGYRWASSSNTCWYADTVVRVKRKYDLSVSESEMRALDNILKGCGQSIGSQTEPAPVP